MHTVPGRCPICSEELVVTRLHCQTCDSVLEGHFALGRFGRLAPEQLGFVETFLRCEGRLNKVQEEMGLSYPTVRSRLHDAIRSLGYEVRGEPLISLEQRKSILNDLGQGNITPDEAVRLLQGEERSAEEQR